MLTSKVTIATGSTSGIRLDIAKGSGGQDMDHYAANTRTVVEHLRNTVHVGHSTGCSQAMLYARYFIAGQTRFAGWLRVLFLSAGAALLAPIVVAQDTIAPGAKVSAVFDQELPNAAQGACERCSRCWTSRLSTPVVNLIDIQVRSHLRANSQTRAPTNV
jgi:pimeloyl-ACP methyl ester carboxylesterase